MSNDVKVNLSVVDKATTVLNKIRSNIGDFSKATESNLASWRKSIIGTFVGIFAAKSIVSGLSAMHEAAKQDRIGMDKLKASIGGVSTALTVQANVLSRHYQVTTGNVVATQAAIGQYVKNESVIKQLTPTILNMATVTGQSTDAITKLIATAIQSGGGLREYGIDLSDCNTIQERTSKITETLDSKFAGQAEAVLKNRDAIDQLKTQFAELQGNIGAIIDTTPGIKGFFDIIIGGVKGWNDLATVANNKQLHSGLKKYQDLLLVQIELDKQLQNLQDQKIRDYDLERTVYVELVRVKEQIAKSEYSSAEQKKRQESINKEIKTAKQTREELTKIAEKKKAELMESQELLNSSIAGLISEGYGREVALLDNKYNKLYAKFKDNKEALLTAEQAYQNELTAITDRELERVYKADQEKAKSRKDAHEKVKSEIQKELELEYDIDMARRESRKQELDGQRNALYSTTDYLRQLSEQHSAFKAIYKANALAQAGIDTYASAQSIYKGFATIPIIGPALGVAGAASAIAFGLQNVAQIAKFASGTQYASGGLSLVGENGPELVNLPRGSQVINNRETKNISTRSTVLNVTINDPSGKSIHSRQIKNGEYDDLVRSIILRAGKVM